MAVWRPDRFRPRVFAPESSARFAVAYYDFTNVQGQLSSPCLVNSASDVCDTDLTRPSFAQRGKHLYAAAEYSSDHWQSGWANAQFQYFGLVGQYPAAGRSGQVDFGDFHPVHVVLDGEYVVNTAFDRALMNSPTTINNRGPDVGPNIPGPFNAATRVGLAASLSATRKSSTSGIGTCMPATSIWNRTPPSMLSSTLISGSAAPISRAISSAAMFGLSENVWATVRWMSANGIAGVPYAVDVLQVD